MERLGFIRLRLLQAVCCAFLVALCSCSCFDWDSYCDGESDYCGHSEGGYDVPPAPMVDLPPPILSIHCEEITKIIQEVSVNFRHKRHLHLEDARTFYNQEGIHTIQMTYYTQDLLDVCKARMLIVDLVDGMLEKLNNNLYLLPEFPNFAFFPFNFEILISCTSFYARYIDPYYMRYICMNDGQISYYAADLLDNNKNCWHVRKESFYTARDIAYYQRLAEKGYDDAHNPLKDIFGGRRYIPPDEDE